MRRGGASRVGAALARESALDVALPARPIAAEFISGRGHYQRVITAVLNAQISVWIGTANLKELLVEAEPTVATRGSARRGRRRSSNDYQSMTAALNELAIRGVELRILHGEMPSRPFRTELAAQPALARALGFRRCPRVHLKVVIVDGALLYLGSANWTGAGLGARGSGRRNFEFGIVTDDGVLLDTVQNLYDQIWRGGECTSCRLRDECPGPLDELAPDRGGARVVPTTTLTNKMPRKPRRRPQK